MNEMKLPPYLVPYLKRRYFSRKIRDTEKEVQRLKDEGDWKTVSRYQWILRNAWWGYKKVKRK